MREFKLFIGGEFVDAEDGETFETTNPSTGEAVATVARGGAADVERAVGAARKAFDEGPWPGMKPLERTKVMLDAFERIKDREGEIAELEAADAGHTMRMANLFTIPYSNEYWRHLAELAQRLEYHEPVEDYAFPTPAWDFVLREPFGVCVGIIPWNVPYMMAIWKLAPALATGNTAVLKPATYTPATACALAEILAETDIPPGVVNVVPGSGSTEIGRRIMQLASGTVKKVTLELGGKSANILLDDADLDIAIPGSTWAMYMHQGQICHAGTRLLAPAALYDEVTARLVETVEGLKIGSAMDFESDLGPLINETQFDTVDRYVQVGQDEGAKLLTGGHRITEDGLDAGYFYEPTIFGEVSNDMKIAQEEIFGPVLSVIRYESVEDAIRLANDSIYGLGGAVWSRDIPRALEVAKRVRTGTVWINDYHLVSPAAPFGGYKQSGIGREHGHWGLQEYLQTKYVRVDQVPTREQKFWYQVIGL